MIRSEFSGDAKDAYVALVTCIRDRPSFFAERIHKAISGIGTRDSTLIRVIVSRSEVSVVIFTSISTEFSSIRLIWHK